MARVGVSITKSTVFRNSTQEFSNVYYFEVGTLPSEAEAQSLITALMALEKGWHSTLVTYVRGRVWSQGGSPGTNNMIAQANLSGTGARAVITSFDKERAFLFKIRAGNDSRGNPVFLRKWFHACGVFVNGQTITSNQLDQSSGFSTAERNAQVAAMNTIRSITDSGKTYTLCAKSGRNFDSGADFQAHPFLEHHQLGDQWRAQ
jgi:hypothetical protein